MFPFYIAARVINYICIYTYLPLGFILQQDKERNPIKRMAELLQQGATLTDLGCPVCHSPLLRLQDGTLWCGMDQKKVVVVREGEEPPKQAVPTKSSGGAYDKLEATLNKKIENIQAKIEKTDDTDEIQKLTIALSELLNSVDKIKKMRA